MSLQLDLAGLRARLAKQLDAPRVAEGLDRLSADPFFLAFFLTSVSQGEGLGEAAVGMIGHQELARHIHDLHEQEAEERGHKERTLDAARELFPEQFDGGRYRYEKALEGASYYVAVLDANRAHLKQAGRHSKLNQYLVTTFGYEVMVVLLYRAVADRVARAPIPAAVRKRVGGVLEGILEEEEGHLGVLDEHEALLALDPAALSAEARAMLSDLDALGTEDYLFAAERSVEQVCEMMARYAEPEAYRARIEAQGA